MKNSIFARFARAVFIFWHLAGVLVLSTTWNDLFWAYDDTCSILSCYRFRRRRVCLSFLLILPYERPIGSGLIWETIWLAIEARHCMKPASSELISIPTFPFSRAIAARQLTFVVLPDNIFWNSCIHEKISPCWLMKKFRDGWAEGTHAYHAIREKLRHELRHPERALDLKTKDLIGHLWVCLSRLSCQSISFQVFALN